MTQASVTFLPGAARGLPLHARDGSIRAFAMVDAEDYPRLSTWAWSLHSAGYAVRTSGGRPFYMHRQILDLEHGDPRQGDHLNGDPLDNRRSNLRICTHAQNGQNRRPRQGKTSAYRGVYWSRKSGKWMARVKINYRHHYLGVFDSEVEAAQVAEDYRREHLPFALPDPELARVLAVDDQARAAA